MKYLDLTGLGEVWANIKSYISSKVPTKTSQLQNDSNYATTSQLPSKTSQLTNDSDFTTNAKLATKQDTISDLATIRSGASKGATAVQPSELNNYVDLSSEQTINGAKTFSFIALKSSRIERGSLPSTNITEDREIEIVDKNNRRILGIFNYYYVSGSGRTSFYAYNPNTVDFDNLAIAFDFNNTDQQKSLIPVANNVVNLGTSTNKWKDVYATTLHGDVDFPITEAQIAAIVV